MNPEVKDKWVEALRSGKYKQGKTTLRTGDHFCCLGVLCDISGLAEWRSMPYQRYLYSELELFLPEDVTDWAEIYAGQYELSEMNDQGRSFTQIADYIEENL